MKTTLPQDDRDAQARQDRLAKQRETYRFAYDWPPGVATSAELPKDDDYGALYLIESAKIYADIGVNLAAMTLDGHEAEDILEGLEERFRNLTAEKLHQLVAGDVDP